MEGEREGKSEYERKWGRSRDSRYRDFPCKAVVAFDAASGRQLWRWNNPGHEFERRAWTVNQLAIAGDAAYLFRTTGQSGDVKACYWVACLELADGDGIERLELAVAFVQHGIAVAHGRIVIACQDGSVVCLGQ